MEDLGYFVRPVKSVLSPSDTWEWLGLLVDFSLRRFAVPKRKVVSIRAVAA